MDNAHQEWKDTVLSGLAYFDVKADSHRLEQLAFHAFEMLKWNRTTNLTSITEPSQVAVKHVIDSAAIVNACHEYNNILDIGTGAGFPGIPLKIVSPDHHITLVETSRKKVTFLKHIIRSTGLDDIRAIQARAEILSADEAFGGRYDAVICRAFSALDTFVNMAVPYLKPNGAIIAMKGKETENESASLEKTDTHLSNGRTVCYEDLDVSMQAYELPIIPSDRVLYTIRIKPESD